jgi:hypothetical protein
MNNAQLTKLRTLIQGYDDGLLTSGELQALAFQALMEDDIDFLKRGLGTSVMTTCCCRYPHNLKDSYIKAEIEIGPHGYSIAPKPSIFKRIVRLFIVSK